MKIKLDENILHRLVLLLRAAGHDVMDVTEENLSGASDPFVVKIAAAEDRVLMTFDKDFADIRQYPIGTHAGIIVFRLPDQRWLSFEPIAKQFIDSGIMEKMQKGLVLVTDKHVRIRFGSKKSL